MKKCVFICVISFLVLVSSCDFFSSLSIFSSSPLQVMFFNGSSSTYSIESIELEYGGESREITLSNSWGDNIIPDGEVLAPNEHFYFDVDLDSGDFTYYRITVTDTDHSLGEITLEYALDDADFPLTFQHWGGPKRTVGVYVEYDDAGGFYDTLYNGVYVSGTRDEVEWDDTLPTVQASWNN
ncbi:MAG: hypothetical protein K9L75_04645 [Spirochaetia bacterium]|nr:hypothetical protein [Spirochaetia bacterium]